MGGTPIPPSARALASLSHVTPHSHFDQIWTARPRARSGSKRFPSTPLEDIRSDVAVINSGPTPTKEPSSSSESGPSAPAPKAKQAKQAREGGKGEKRNDKADDASALSASNSQAGSGGTVASEALSESSRTDSWAGDHDAPS